VSFGGTFHTSEISWKLSQSHTSLVYLLKVEYWVSVLSKTNSSCWTFILLELWGLNTYLFLQSGWFLMTVINFQPCNFSTLLSLNQELISNNYDISSIWSSKSVMTWSSTLVQLSKDKMLKRSRISW
jgi:hypothetical protein